MKKIISLLVAVVLSLASVTTLTACGSSSVSDDENTIEVRLFNGGYGLEWFERICEEFKKIHPEANIIVSNKIQYGQAKTLLSGGPVSTTTDLFMGSEPVMQYVLYGDSLLKGYDCVLEDLTDVYKSTVSGESVTIEEKMIEGFAEYYKINDKYYSYPWVSGVCAIVYNKTQFDELGLSVPRTTDELFDDTCQTIKDAGKIPFVSSKANTYDYFVWEVWKNQYYSLAGMDDYYQCRRYNDLEDEYEYSAEVYHDEGELALAQAEEKMIGVRYGNMHENVNTMTFTQAQAQLLLGKGLMYVCGDWLENEMKNQKGNGDTLKYMKTPIISAIINKVPKHSIANDNVLREVVDYVDGVTAQKPAGVADEDIEYVREARQIENLCTFQSAYVPAYSKSKALVKELLKFMATDEVIQICLDTTGGSSLPFNYNIREDTARWNNYSEFIKSKYDLLQSAQMVVDKNKYHLQVFGALKKTSSKVGVGYTYFTSKNAADRNTAEEWYADLCSYFTDAVLNQALERAGIL